jgi:hypothetical protein
MLRITFTLGAVAGLAIGGWTALAGDASMQAAWSATPKLKVATMLTAAPRHQSRPAKGVYAFACAEYLQPCSDEIPCCRNMECVAANPQQWVCDHRQVD